MSITPFPSTSYIRNAHFNFSSGVPLDVTSMASRNSCNEKAKYNQLFNCVIHQIVLASPLSVLRSRSVINRSTHEYQLILWHYEIECHRTSSCFPLPHSTKWHGSLVYAQHMRSRRSKWIVGWMDGHSRSILWCEYQWPSCWWPRAYSKRNLFKGHSVDTHFKYSQKDIRRVRYVVHLNPPA